MVEQTVIDDKHSLIKAYQEDDFLRGRFNELAGDVFGIDFEPWYAKGLWTDNYIPYSILAGDEIIANISVSPMDFIHEGRVIRLIQLGTVMTREDHRHKGWISRLMAEVEKDYNEKSDGAFLFANDRVTELYPRFGYRRGSEVRYAKDVSGGVMQSAQPVSLKDPDAWREFAGIIRASQIQNDLWLSRQAELTLFHVLGYMTENVFKLDNGAIWVIAEIDGSTLILHQVFSRNPVDLDQIVTAFGPMIRRVELGFTPLCRDGFSGELLREENTTMFVKGAWFETFEARRLRFPSLART